MKVGDKVVCVDDDFTTHKINDPNFHLMFKQLPVKDEVYTVRSIDSVAIRLNEVVNPIVPINLGDRSNPIWIEDEPAFHISRFAPLLNNRDELTDNVLNGILKDIGEDSEVLPYLVPDTEEELLVY